MIILPPEKKKSSPILKWIFRILLIFVIFAGLTLFVLNILSGTSDAHRQGLERAFSDMFKTPVTIGKLKVFNIFPKFTIEMENIRAYYGADGGEVRAERVVMVFRFFDILFGRDLIENFQILNLTLTPNIIGEHGVMIHMAGIAPATKDHAPLFVLTGEYGGLPILGSLQLQQESGVQPVYRVVNDMPASFKFGKLEATGKFSQTGSGEPSIHSADFLLEDKKFATGKFVLRTSQPALGVEIDMATPQSQMKFTTTPHEHRQVWNFEKLDLGDVMGAQAVWSNVSQALSKISPAVTKAETANETQISVNIKSLTGAITAQDLRGNFISTPTEFTGWWDGKFMASSASSASSAASPAAGVIQCGLLSLLPVGQVWATKDALIQLDPVTLKMALSVDPVTGGIESSLDRVAEGRPTPFGIDLKSFNKLKAGLAIPADHPCLSFFKELSPL